MKSTLALLQSASAAPGTSKGGWLLLAQFSIIFIVIIAMGGIAYSMVLVRSRRQAAQAAQTTTPGQPSGQSPQDDGSLYVVILGISAAVFGFLVILFFADQFQELSSALGFLTALFGAITGLVGTYFGIKSSSDARQGAQEAQQGRTAGLSLPSTVTVTPVDATKNVDASHTVTATVRQGGSPAADVPVTFRIIDGPDNDVPPRNDVTDSSGQANFPFTNKGGPGTDIIEAVAPEARGTARVTFIRKEDGQQEGGGTGPENAGREN